MSATDGTNLMNSIHVWTENVNTTAGTFTGCYSYTGDQTTHDNGAINASFVVYQKNIHRRMSYVEGDQISLSTWSRGAQCVKVKTKVNIFSKYLLV